MTRTCRNPQCRDTYRLNSVRLCPNCMLAGKWGGAVAFLAVGAWHALPKVNWVQALKTLLVWTIG